MFFDQVTGKKQQDACATKKKKNSSKDEPSFFAQVDHVTRIQCHRHGRNDLRETNKANGKGIARQFIDPPTNKRTHHPQSHDEYKSSKHQIFEFYNSTGRER